MQSKIECSTTETKHLKTCNTLNTKSIMIQRNCGAKPRNNTSFTVTTIFL